MEKVQLLLETEMNPFFQMVAKNDRYMEFHMINWWQRNFCSSIPGVKHWPLLVPPPGVYLVFPGMDTVRVVEKMMHSGCG